MGDISRNSGGIGRPVGFLFDKKNDKKKTDGDNPQALPGLQQPDEGLMGFMPVLPLHTKHKKEEKEGEKGCLTCKFRAYMSPRKSIY
jgi:hypothetical protein